MRSALRHHRRSRRHADTFFSPRLELLEDRMAPSVTDLASAATGTALLTNPAPSLQSTSLVPAVSTASPAATTTQTSTAAPLLTLTLKPLDINLLGLEIQSNAITVTITPQQGAGDLLGNLLTTVSNIVNVNEANTALNNVLGATVDLLNSAELHVNGVGSGSLTTAQAATTPVLNLTVAPVHLNLLGAEVDTSPVNLTISAHSGPGLVLGNVITDLANVMNPPLPQSLNVGNLTQQINNLLVELESQVPGVTPASVASAVTGTFTAANPNVSTIAAAGPNGGPITEVVVTPDNSLWWHQDGGAWTQIGAPGTIASVSAVADNSGQVVAFAVTTSHALYRFSLAGGWQEIGAPGTISTVSAGTDSTGMAAAFVLATDGTLHEFRSSGWVANALGAAGTITQMSAGRNDRLAVVTADGTVAEYSAASGWLDISSAGFAKQISAVTESSGNLAVFAVEQNGAWARYNDGGSWQQLGAAGTVAAVTAGLDASGHAEAFVIGSDGSPLELSDAGWRQLGGADTVNQIVGANNGIGILLGSDGSVLEALDGAGIAPLTSQNFATLPAAAPPNETSRQVLSLTVPAINLNLLGLVLTTTPITVNATAQTGSGDLLGNVLTTLLNTLNATPDQMNQLNDSINRLLGEVVGILNASSLTLPSSALQSLSQVLQSLALPNLTTTAATATTPILNLVIASPNPSTPPVDVNLLGLNVTTSNISAQIVAQTGNGEVLGNLLYNVANLLNPGGPTSLITILTELAAGSSASTTGSGTGSSSSAASPLLTLTLPALNLNLLGLQVRSNTITVTISDQAGNGELLGNLLTGLSSLINTQGVSNALNQVLATTVGLLNSVSLQVPTIGSGTFTNGTTATTPVLSLNVAPVHLNLLGVLVDTSPIQLTITAQSGTGLVLGNVLTDLADLFDPPLPAQLNLATINDKLNTLLTELNQQIPNIASAPVSPVTLSPGQILSLTVPPLDLNLLGLMLQTSAITVNATAQTGNGDLLGNVLQVVLNTLNATPAELNQLSNNLNALLAKVVGVLNVATLTLPASAVSSLSGVLQTLAGPTLIAPASGASTPILNLVVASTDNSTPPVSVNLLGLLVTTSNINAVLSAQTGDGLILGNLLYNVANLMNPGGAADLLFLLTELGQ